MAKKPVFVSPGAEKSDAEGQGDKDAAPTRLYRDPAEKPVPEASPAAPTPTRILSPQTDPSPAETIADSTKTRLVSSEPPEAPTADVTRLVSIEPTTPAEPQDTRLDDQQAVPVVGWLVIVDGPGRGMALAFGAGMNAIGRGADNAVVLDFGDEEIAEEAHAFIVYDQEDRSFHVTHAGQTSLVRLNDEPLLEAKPIDTGAQLRLGQTTLRFSAFCGPDFDWSGD